MQILIIEDDLNKLKEIRSFLVSNSDYLVEEARSYHSALQAVSSKSFDAVLMDMSLPTFDTSADEPGGRPRSFGGKDLLSQMRKKDIFTPVIIITQFDEFGEGTNKISLAQLSADLKQRFSDNYIGTIYYNASRYDWKSELLELLKTVEQENSK